MDVDRDEAGGGTGSARRRRERRLRAYLRYARMSVAMALAESTHHSARRWLGPGERHELHFTATFRKPLSPKDGFCGTLWDICPRLLLVFLCPQMVDQLPDIEHFFAALSPEQVIEVPKILPLDVPMRAALRVTQLVEQLVEVPTIISYSSLRRTMEQQVDIPVPRRGGRSTGLQGFLPGQSSTASSSSSKKRIPERTVEQIVRFTGEGLQDSRPGQVSPASSSFQSPAGSDDDANEPGDGVFRTFPHGKKCGVPGRSVRTCPGTSAHGPRRLMRSPGGPMSRRWRKRRRRRSTRGACSTSTSVLPTTFQSARRNTRLGVVGLAFLLLRRTLLGRGGRGRRGARENSQSPLLVCGYGAVCTGSALALLPRAVFPLYGPLYLTVTNSLFSWFDSGYNLRQFTLAFVGTETGTHSAYCACFERFHRCSSWARFARASLCNDRCRLSSGHPCCGAEAVPHGPFVHAHGAVLGQSFSCRSQSL